MYATISIRYFSLSEYSHFHDQDFWTGLQVHKWGAIRIFFFLAQFDEQQRAGAWCSYEEDDSSLN